jgi:hypothetical protein
MASRIERSASASGEPAPDSPRKTTRRRRTDSAQKHRKEAEVLQAFSDPFIDVGRSPEQEAEMREQELGAFRRILSDPDRFDLIVKYAEAERSGDVAALNTFDEAIATDRRLLLDLLHSSPEHQERVVSVLQAEARKKRGDSQTAD